MPARFFFTVGVLPGDGRANAFVTQSLNYTSIDAALTAVTNALVSPPLDVYLPVMIEEELPE